MLDGSHSSSEEQTLPVDDRVAAAQLTSGGATVPQAEPHAANSLINGRAGALASRKPWTGAPSRDGSVLRGTAMVTALLKAHFDEWPLTDPFHQSCPRARRQSLPHLDTVVEMQPTWTSTNTCQDLLGR